MSTQAHDKAMDVINAMGKRQCRATNRQGKRCGKSPILGGTVCRMHGGSIGRVKRKALQRVQDMLADAIDPNRVLREAGRLAYSNIQDLYGDDGKLLPIKQWPENIARCVASIEEERITGNVDKGDGKLDQIVKVKVRLWDKPGKLQDLMKHHGQLTERVDHSGALEIKWKGEEPQGVVVDAELTGNNTALALPEQASSKPDSDLEPK